MKRVLFFVYGSVCYAVFLGVFLYLAGFLGNLLVPRGIDSPAEVPLGQALLVNLALVALFGLQHTVMARPTFKRWWTRLVPQPIERATYVMATNVALILLFWLWQPMGGVIWDVQNAAGRAILYGVFAFGLLTVLATTFLIDHFDLFGMRQVWLYLLGKPYTPIKFSNPGPYKLVRHPLYVGWLTAFWATPTMTAAHLAFALGMTVYILVAIYFEERNLVEYHGQAYSEYRRRVPMLIPRLPGKAETPRGEAVPEPAPEPATIS